MTEMTLTISGMSCGHCVMHVQKALASMPGVQVKKVEIGKAQIVYDDASVTPEVLRQAVAGAGYQVTA